MKKRKMSVCHDEVLRNDLTWEAVIGAMVRERKWQVSQADED